MWLFYSNCGFAVGGICLFLAVSSVGLGSVILAFPGHTNLVLPCVTGLSILIN